MSEEKRQQQPEKWTISLNEEFGFCGDYPSRGEAIKAGIAETNGDPFYIGKARPPAPLSQGIDSEGIITEIIEGPLEEDWFIEIAEDWQPTPEQYKDLDSRLKAVADQWIKDHNLEPDWFLCNDIERIDPMEKPPHETP